MDSQALTKHVTSFSKYVCQVIIDVKEKKKTSHIGLAELDIFINHIQKMIADKIGGETLLQSLIDLCTEAKSCLKGDLN